MRYALYFTPPAGDALTRLGSSWLGRNALTGEDVAQPELEDVTARQLHALTVDPRRYGFHATLKAPFHLAEGRTEEELRDAFSEFCERMPAFDLPALQVETLGAFVALTPSAPLEALDVFAASCVETFEPFRAPLSQANMERRRASGLNSRQDAFLQRWGYPYVFEEFRFHMTLSSKISESAEIEALSRNARQYFAPVTQEPTSLATVAIFAEPEPGAPFTMIDIKELAKGRS